MRLPAWMVRLALRNRLKEVDRIMSKILQKLIGNNFAGVLGIVQTLIPLVREIVVLGIRIVDTVLAEADLEPAVERWVTRVNQIEQQFVWFKNLFLPKKK